MRTSIFLAASIAAVSARAEVPGSAWALVQGPNGTIKADLFSEQHAGLPIAQVEGRVVTLGDLSYALVSAHAAHRGKAAGKKDYTPVLDRLIGMRLIFLEAHEMGLDELPDIRQEMARFEESSLREALKAPVTKGITADPAEVERVYKDSVREWRVKSALFETEADAKANKARGREETQLVSAARHALTQVIEALKGLKPGELTAPVPVGKGFAVLRVEAITYPEDPKKRSEAEEGSLGRRQATALRTFYEGLVKKYARIDPTLLEKLDFEAKRPGFESLLRDTRVVARIEGGKDVTVSEVAKGLNDEFFHGVQRAISERKVNARKVPVFNSILYEELFNAEARRQGVAQGADYLKTVNDHRDALVFTRFVEKVILPDVRVTEGDIKKHYDGHKADYTYPPFYTLSSIAFETPAAAQAAMGKVKRGTDFKWLKSNAPGQLAEARREIEFDGSTVAGSGIPADLGKLLSATKTGDVRLYAPREGGHYLIRVDRATPPAPQPYAEARTAIAPKVQQLKINQAVDDWIARLRKARPVKVYISRIGS